MEDAVLWLHSKENRMIYWNRPLPELQIDWKEYKPFIKNEWFRSHYMWFTYGLMGLIFAVGVFGGVLKAGSPVLELLIILPLYVTHELLHILVVFRKGDLYLNYFGGIYLWLTPDVALGKGRFWLFITLPFLVLTPGAGIAGMLIGGRCGDFLWYLAWVNAIIAGSDILNSVLIAVKPKGSLFYRGYYKNRS